MPTYPVFKGNWPTNVKKDTKYTLRTGANGPVVAIIYEAEEDERWHPSTDNHLVQDGLSLIEPVISEAH